MSSCCFETLNWRGTPIKHSPLGVLIYDNDYGCTTFLGLITLLLLLSNIHVTLILFYYYGLSFGTDVTIIFLGVIYTDLGTSFSFKDTSSYIFPPISPNLLLHSSFLISLSNSRCLILFFSLLVTTRSITEAFRWRISFIIG